MIYAPPVLLCIAMILYGRAEGIGDALDILAKRPIDHAEGLFRRVCIALCAVVIVFGLVMPHTWASFLSSVLMAYGSFTPSFRLTINSRRSKPWWYISNSNGYDRRFIGLCGPSIPWAGTCAYIVELSAFAIGAGIYFTNL